MGRAESRSVYIYIYPLQFKQEAKSQVLQKKLFYRTINMVNLAASRAQQHYPQWSAVLLSPHSNMYCNAHAGNNVDTMYVFIRYVW